MPVTVNAVVVPVQVIVVSADLSELRKLAHRICVMSRGRITRTLPPTASDHDIGRALLGAADGEEAA